MRFKITKTRAEIAIEKTALNHIQPKSPLLCTSAQTNARNNELTIEMAVELCKNELSEMLAAVEHRTTFSLNIMGRRLASNGRSLDNDFMRHFLEVTNQRLIDSYAKARTTLQREDDNSMDTQNGCHKLNDVQNVMNIVEIFNSDDDEMAEQLQSSHLQVVRPEQATSELINFADNSEVNSHVNNGKVENNGETKKELNVERKHENNREDVRMGTFNSNNEVTIGEVNMINDSDRNADDVKSSVRSNFCKESDKLIGNSHSPRDLCSNLKKRFMCRLCSYSFNKNAYLTRHMLIHTDEKPFKCTICSRCFKRKDNLKQHLKVHAHVVPFFCRHCLQGFNQLNKKAAHEETCGCYKCDICNEYSTKNKSKLNRHMREHSAMK